MHLLCRLAITVPTILLFYNALTMTQRHYNLADRFLMDLHKGLQTLSGAPRNQRENPSEEIENAPLDRSARRHAAGLMRVNHAGEVAAQALYQGQAATARLPEVREAMEEAAREEEDHLAWCEQRLAELGEKPSRLGPFWYVGSFAIGAAAGLAGDKWSLGFVAETEKQVCDHLDGHLEKLPDTDNRSRAIVEQMKADEARHGETAVAAGAAELPRPVRDAMKLASKIMTRAAYWF